MSETHPKWLSARTVHLAGGCRAVNDLAPTVKLYPSTPDGQIVQFQSREYGALYSEIEALNLTLIGTEFLSNSLEAKELVPPNWRTFHRWSPHQVWPCNDEVDKWAQIAHAAVEISNAVLWDLARRISHQLRVCEWRLYQLSEAYRSQLHTATTDRDFKPGTRFTDGFTWLGYLAVQVFLVDACILRDYLAEFYAQFACPAPLNLRTEITTMSGLKKKILNKLTVEHELTVGLQSATSRGGWLHVLGAYRDLIVHCVPLARAESQLLALATELPIRRAKSLASISLPLPSDPSGIAAARAPIKRTDRLAEELRLLTNATHGEAPSKDALVYCYENLDSLTRLVTHLAEHSPVSPKILQLTEKDIIGTIEMRRV